MSLKSLICAERRRARAAGIPDSELEFAANHSVIADFRGELDNRRTLSWTSFPSDPPIPPSPTGLWMLGFPVVEDPSVEGIVARRHAKGAEAR